MTIIEGSEKITFKILYGKVFLKIHSASSDAKAIVPLMLEHKST